jgi:nucleotide-binding universal stress UspA family protein
MAPDEDYSKIVVGYDGSKGSELALEWAAREARLRGVPLSVVRAWTTGEFGTDEELGDFTQQQLEKDVAEALSHDQSLPWQAVAAMGSPAKVLIEHSAGAQMLVVGSRGHGGFAGLLLGSISQQVSAHSGAPVVVIVRDAG